MTHVCSEQIYINSRHGILHCLTDAPAANADACILSGGQTTRIMSVTNTQIGATPTKPMTLRSLTYTLGWASSGGALQISNFATVHLLLCHFHSNKATSSKASAIPGGAITVSTASHLQLHGTVFEENVAMAGYGGDLAISDATATVTISPSCRGNEFLLNLPQYDPAATPGSTVMSIHTPTPSQLTGLPLSYTCTPASICGPGTFGPAAGSCTPCPSGTIQPSHNATTSPACTPCPAGTVATLTLFCVPCVPGSYATGGTTCTTCGGGSYATASACTTCPSGRYAQPPASECLPCPLGKYGSFAGAVVCTDCGVGKYGPGTEATTASECVECDGGTHNPEPAAEECEKCPEGTYAAAVGAVVCDECGSLPVGDEGGSVSEYWEFCSEAPTGVQTSEPTVEAPEMPMEEYEQCEPGLYSECGRVVCGGGEGCESCGVREHSDSTRTYCAMAFACDEGSTFSLNDGVCNVCNNKHSGLILAVAFFWFLIVMGLVARIAHYQHEMQCLKILSTFLQCMQLTTLIKIPWKGGSGNLIPFAMPFADARCIAHSLGLTFFSAVVNFYTIVYVPLALFLVLGAMRLWFEDKDSLRNRISLLAIYLIVLWYSPLLQTVASMYECYEDPELGWRLVRDASVTCEYSTSRTIVLVHCFSLMALTAAFPIFIIWYTRHRRHTNRLTAYSIFSKFYKWYTKKRPYFEAVHMLRKAALIFSCTVFPSSLTQGCLCLGINAVFLAFFVWKRPMLEYPSTVFKGYNLYALLEATSAMTTMMGCCLAIIGSVAPGASWIGGAFVVVHAAYVALFMTLLVAEQRAEDRRARSKVRREDHGRSEMSVHEVNAVLNKSGTVSRLMSEWNKSIDIIRQFKSEDDNDNMLKALDDLCLKKSISAKKVEEMFEEGTTVPGEKRDLRTFLRQLDKDCFSLGMCEFSGEMLIWEQSVIEAYQDPNSADPEKIIAEIQKSTADMIKRRVDMLEDINFRRWELAINTENLVALNHFFLRIQESETALMVYLIGKNNNTYLQAARSDPNLAMQEWVVRTILDESVEQLDVIGMDIMLRISDRLFFSWPDWWQNAFVVRRIHEDMAARGVDMKKKMTRYHRKKAEQNNGASDLDYADMMDSNSRREGGRESEAREGADDDGGDDSDDDDDELTEQMRVVVGLAIHFGKNKTWLKKNSRRSMLRKTISGTISGKNMEEVLSGSSSPKSTSSPSTTLMRRATNGLARTGLAGLSGSGGAVIAPGDRGESFVGVTLNSEEDVEAIEWRDCNLVGTVPEEIGKLVGLKTLVLCNNNIMGELPKGMWMKQIVKVDLSVNSVVAITEDVRRSTNMEALFVEETLLFYMRPLRILKKLIPAGEVSRGKLIRLSLPELWLSDKMWGPKYCLSDNVKTCCTQTRLQLG